MDKPTYEKFKRYCVSKNYELINSSKVFMIILMIENGRRQMEKNL